MGKKSTTKEFIEKAINIHSDKYDYSLVEYINQHTKIKIICKRHNIIFSQKPRKHLDGQGCKLCSGLRTNEEFIKESINIHGHKYIYDLVEYKNSHKNVIINCPKHGVFKQTPANHLSGSGCPECCNKKRYTSEEFIEKAIKIHGDKYDYSLVEYINTHKKIKIKCKKHDIIFEQTPKKHLFGQGCWKCNESKGETLIHDILTKNDITYIRQHTFENCKNIKLLPFDFYLPEFNMCIEFDGIQHFKPVDFFGGQIGYDKLVINDNLKNDYCLINNITLIRIKYNDKINANNLIYKIKKSV